MVMRAELTRRVILPSLFGLRGEQVARELSRLRAAEHEAAAAIREEQFRKLAALLRLAEADCPFYRDRFRQHGVTASDFRAPADLGRFPLLEKSDLPRLLSQSQHLRRRLRGLQARKTAGSSGNPAVVVADAEANAKSLAARYRAFSWYGISPGDKEVRFWGRPLRESRWRQAAKNGLLNRLVVDSALLDRSAILPTIRRIARAREVYAYGYSSMMLTFVESLAAYPELRGSIRCKAAVCTSESIAAFERARIAATLDCPAPREYGCSETDIIAFECPRGQLHVVEENVYLEVVPTVDADDGTGEIIITDLNNLAMPLIRYRIGDVGAIAESDCPCGRNSRVISRLMGRKMGQYIRLSDGRLVHSQVIAYAFEDVVAAGYPIRRFRAIQSDGTTVLIKILPGEGTTAQLSEAADLIAGKLRATLRDTALTFRFEFVTEAEFQVIDRKFSHFESRIE